MRAKVLKRVRKKYRVTYDFKYKNYDLFVNKVWKKSYGSHEKALSKLIKMVRAEYKDDIFIHIFRLKFYKKNKKAEVARCYNNPRVI